jgi:hypothetical protein
MNKKPSDNQDSIKAGATSIPRPLVALDITLFKDCIPLILDSATAT